MSVTYTPLRFSVSETRSSRFERVEEMEGYVLCVGCVREETLGGRERGSGCFGEWGGVEGKLEKEGGEMDDLDDAGLDDSGERVNFGVEGGGGGDQARSLLEVGVVGRGCRRYLLAFARQDRDKAKESERGASSTTASGSSTARSSSPPVWATRAARS